MKLTKEEIKYIDNYLIKNDVKFWDVRLELLDHMVSAVEDKIENKGISFNEALLEVHQGFGNRIQNGYTNEINFEKALFIDGKGFKKFTFKKQKEIGRKHRRVYRKTFLSFLLSYQFFLEYILLIILVLTINQFNPKMVFVIAMIACYIPELAKVFFGAFEKANLKSLNMQMAMTNSSLFISLSYFMIYGFNSYYSGVLDKPYIIITVFCMILFPFLRQSFNCYKSILKENRRHYKMLIS